MIIDTKQGFEILRIINKLGIKKEIVETITKSNKNKTIENNIYKTIALKVRDKVENYEDLEVEEQSNLYKETLEENVDIKEKLDKLNEENIEIGSDLMFTFLERLPIAEKEVYKLIANIYNIKVTEAEQAELDVTVDRVKGIVQSETVQKLFTLATR